ncbi:MAG: helix-turn-helix domain-containing protein [Phycisphaerales bacterium]
MATKTRNQGKFRGPPTDTYAGLVAALPPRPLHDATDYENAVEMVGRLAGYDLNADQGDYLEALAVFVERYEAEHEDTHVDTSRVTGPDLLRSLMEANDLTTSDAGAILNVDRSHISHLLAGRRAMTWDHAKALADRFGLSAAVFMD